MRYLCVLASLLLFLTNQITAQVIQYPIPECALTCVNTVCSASNHSCICAAYSPKEPLAVCIHDACGMQVSLMTLDITAAVCQWPAKDRSSQLKISSLASTIVTTMFLMARITARSSRFSGTMGLDDYMIVVAWVFSVGYTLLNWLSGDYGFGKDVWGVSPDQLVVVYRLIRIGLLIYTIISWFTRISVLLLYLRLFPDVNFRRVVKVLLVLCCMACVAFTAGFSLQLWRDEHESRSSATVTIHWTQTYIVIFADLGIVLLPLRTVWKLNLGWEKKINIMAMFGVGLFVTAISVYRTIILAQLINSINVTWDWIILGIWTITETNVGILCACMPGMRGFVTKIYPAQRWNGIFSKPATKDQHESSGSPSESNRTIGSGGSMLRRQETKSLYELTMAETMTETTMEIDSGTGRVTSTAV